MLLLQGAVLYGCVLQGTVLQRLALNGIVLQRAVPVSYTHLTLPTSVYV